MHKEQLSENNNLISNSLSPEIVAIINLLTDPETITEWELYIHNIDKLQKLVDKYSNLDSAEHITNFILYMIRSSLFGMQDLIHYLQYLRENYEKFCTRKVNGENVLKNFKLSFSNESKHNSTESLYVEYDTKTKTIGSIVFVLNFLENIIDEILSANQEISSEHNQVKENDQVDSNFDKKNQSLYLLKDKINALLLSPPSHSPEDFYYLAGIHELSHLIYHLAGFLTDEDLEFNSSEDRIKRICSDIELSALKYEIQIYSCRKELNLELLNYKKQLLKMLLQYRMLLESLDKPPDIYSAFPHTDLGENFWIN